MYIFHVDRLFFPKPSQGTSILHPLIEEKYLDLENLKSPETNESGLDPDLQIILNFLRT